MVPTPSAAVADLPASVSQPTPADEARPFTVVGPADMPFDWEEFETSKLMYDIYGFVAPLPLPTRPSSIDKKGRTLLSRAVGLRRNDSEFFESPVASFALEFLELLDTSKTPKNSTWDISSANRMSIMGSELFRRMRVIEHMEGKWYAFDFKEAATVPWMVAVCVSAASDRGITAHRLRSRSRAIEPWHWILHASSSQVAATFHSSPCNHCPSSST